MPWTSFTEWKCRVAWEGREEWELHGYGYSPAILGGKDLAAEIRREANVWRINVWPGPATNLDKQEHVIEGTREQAQALAIVLARLG